MNRLLTCAVAGKQTLFNSAVLRAPAIKQYYCNINSKTKKFVTPSFSYPIITRLFHSTKALKYCSNNAANVNTNLLKDVIIFKHENPKFFKYMNIFAYCQFLFWSYLSHFAYTELRDIPIDPDTITDKTPWWQNINLGESKYRTGFAIFCFTIGM